MLRTVTLLLLLVLAAHSLVAQTANTAVALSDNGNRSAVGPETRPAPSTAPAVAPPMAPAAATVYHVAEEMPAFAGGPAAFQKFLRDKLRYPEEALRKGVSGKVHVSFTVDEQGRILDPQVVRGLGAGLDEEALRLVRIMPWWTPGRIAGQPVRVAYTLPIVFRALE